MVGFDEMHCERPDGTRTELSTRLVERASTAPPPEHGPEEDAEFDEQGRPDLAED
ncbi:hypothetical protein S1361_30725 [Streptomyces cyanogenus]|uniref:Uncharacterized protein n=1 Tax=Streptomyces cyanogenus TaxID=80860 RepID=A0ABX7U1B4_STRCY|nr:hypothetical protein S1361_30725 [Streptomyces cyanogenus]